MGLVEARSNEVGAQEQANLGARISGGSDRGKKNEHEPSLSSQISSKSPVELSFMVGKIGGWEGCKKSLGSPRMLVALA
jgi:hypothetical protein